MEVTLYQRPKGKKRVIDMRNLHDDDEAFFLKHDVKISLEESPTIGFIVYADYGVRDPEGGPVEAVEISYGRDCHTTMHALRLKVEDAISREKK